MRFPEFTNVWEKNYLSKYLVVSSLKNKNDYFTRNDVLSVSGDLGCVNQIQLLGRSFAGASLIPYHVVELNDIVYTKSPLAEYPYGIIKTNRYKIGIVSTLYAVYKTTNHANNKFIEHYFGLKSRINNYLKPIVRIGAKHDMKIGNSEVLNNYVIFPNVPEQKKIAIFIDLLTQRINTQSKIIEDLELFKKGIWNYIYLTKSSDWKCVKLSDILCERKDFALKGDEFIHATLSKDGIFAKTDRYDRDFLVTNDEKEYKITRLNDICYNPANLKFGVICLNKFGDAIFSPIYVTYIVKNDFIPSFVKLILTSSRFLKYIRKYEQGTVYERMAVNSEDFLKGEILIPTKDKQKAIADYFDMLDLKIKKEKDILELYKKQKAYLLKNMFI